MFPTRQCHPGPIAAPRADNRQGFTLLEVVIAVVLLTAGVGALISTATLTVRLTVRGRQTTRAIQAATSQLEALRGVAAAGPAYCGGLSDGGDSSADGTRWRWRVRPAGALREAAVVVSVPAPGGPITDSMVASVWCP